MASLLAVEVLGSPFQNENGSIQPFGMQFALQAVKAHLANDDTVPPPLCDSEGLPARSPLCDSRRGLPMLTRSARTAHGLRQVRIDPSAAAGLLTARPVPAAPSDQDRASCT